MSVIYEKQLMLAKKDFFQTGGTTEQWKDMMKQSNYTLRECGFKDGYEANRVARKNARRV